MNSVFDSDEAYAKRDACGCLPVHGCRQRPEVPGSIIDFAYRHLILKLNSVIFFLLSACCMGRSEHCILSLN